MEAEVLKVSAKSNPNLVAGAIAGVLREGREVEMQVIGAGSVNQAVKAVAVARAFLADDGIRIAMLPSFMEVAMGEEPRTAIRLEILRL